MSFMQMGRDELEYAISQYLDGTLSPLERTALEERLAADAEARAILEEYRSLDSAMKNSMPMPVIAWDRFAAQVAQALANEEAPTKHYSLRTAVWARRMAIAASILLVVGVAFQVTRHETNPSKSSGVAMVTGPAAEASTIAAVEQIQIGPAPNLASNLHVDEEIVSRPSIVLIDQAGTSGQDSDLY